MISHSLILGGLLGLLLGLAICYYKTIATAWKNRQTLGKVNSVVETLDQFGIKL